MLVLTGCSFFDDVLDNSSSTEGCSGSSRFSANDVTCGKSAASLSAVLKSNGTSTSYDFGSVETYARSTVTIELSNSGSTAATSISGDGLDAPYYYYGGSYPGTNGTCGSTLAAGGTCTVVLSYVPTTVATHTDTAVFSYYDGENDKTVSFSLTGTGSGCASTEVNQSQTDTGNGVGDVFSVSSASSGYEGAVWVAQSFYMATGEKIGGATFKFQYIHNNSYDVAAEDPYVEIQANCSGYPCGTALITSDTQEAPSALSDVYFTFSTTYTTTSSTTYWAVLKLPISTSLYVDQIHVLHDNGTNGSNYSDGRQDYRTGASWSGNSNRDYYFKIYTCVD